MNTESRPRRFLALMALAFILAACGAGDDTATAPPPSSAPGTTSIPEPTSIPPTPTPAPTPTATPMAPAPAPTPTPTAKPVQPAVAVEEFEAGWNEALTRGPEVFYSFLASHTFPRDSFTPEDIRCEHELIRPELLNAVETGDDGEKVFLTLEDGASTPSASDDSSVVYVIPHIVDLLTRNGDTRSLLMLFDAQGAMLVPGPGCFAPKRTAYDREVSESQARAMIDDLAQGSTWGRRLSSPSLDIAITATSNNAAFVVEVQGRIALVGGTERIFDVISSCGTVTRLYYADLGGTANNRSAADPCGEFAAGELEGLAINAKNQLNEECGFAGPQCSVGTVDEIELYRLVEFEAELAALLDADQ